MKELRWRARPWRCRLGLHRWREIPRLWWSLGPPGFDCELCGKREWMEP